MGGQRGRDVLIRIGDGGAPENFAAIAGIRARTISLSAGLVDATTAESPEAWRELIAGAGTKRAEVAGSGDEHREIFEAIRNGDPDLAAAIALVHVVHGRKPTLAMLATSCCESRMRWSSVSRSQVRVP